MTLIDYIAVIENARREKEIAARKEHRLLVPKLDDYELIPDIYERFKEIPVPKDFFKSVFVLVIVSLYSPKSIIGYSLNGGLRNKLASIFGCHRSLVSHIMRNTIFWYKNDKAYQETVNRVLSELGYSDF